MTRRFLPGLFAAAVCLAGCLHPVREKVDGVVCELAALPRDLQPASHGDSPAASAEGGGEAAKPEEAVKQASAQKSGKLETPDKTPLPQPKISLTVPEELLPGGPVPPITLPPLTPGWEEARRKAIEKLFPPLPELGEDVPAPVLPGGAPLTLADLQRLALANSPLVKQAAARVEEMRG